MDITDAGFVKHWQKVGPLLEQFERDEMRRYTLADRQRDIQALLSVPIIIPPSDTSGLVEQQRIFQKARHQIEIQQRREGQESSVVEK